MEARFKEFEEVLRAHGALATRALGIVHVPIAEIVGSVRPGTLHLASETLG